VGKKGWFQPQPPERRVQVLQTKRFPVFGFDKIVRCEYTVRMPPLSDNASNLTYCRRLLGALQALGLAALLLSGCASYNSHLQAQSFAESARAYGLAIQWSDYESAVNFLEHPPPSEDLGRLKTFKVTAYEIRKVKFLDNMSRADQTVAIRYYKIDELIERSVVDQQTWVYHPEAKNWYLQSGLPDLG
jgi:hypothetical protein